MECEGMRVSPNSNVNWDLGVGIGNTTTCAAFLCALCILMSASAAQAEQPAYTNHAGYAISGVVIALDVASATISNAAETVVLPLSVFPKTERRRIAADYVLGHPEAGAGALLVPADVRSAVLANERAIRRARLRAEKGLCKKEESDDFCKKSAAALDAWLDDKVDKGEILSAEREVLRAVSR